MVFSKLPVWLEAKLVNEKHISEPLAYCSIGIIITTTIHYNCSWS